MKRTLILLLLLNGFAAPAQKILRGLVLDAEKNAPIAGASVFLSNTSTGTKTNDAGKFELTIPNGRYDLVISSIGYETFSKTISSSEPEASVTVHLKTKEQVLETVVIEPYEKNGWQTWGKFFIDNFIGTSALASDCRIKNTDVIKFRNSKKTGIFSARAFEPLIIENKALGYIVHYQLESFQFDFNSHYLSYTGYPFFEPMKGNKARQKRWDKKRAEVYYGSMMHFMRSVFRNTLLQDGFEVRALQKIPNNEKKRVKQAYASNLVRNTLPDGTIVVTHVNNDSAGYYDRIMHQEDVADVIGKAILPGDSIAFAVNPHTAGLAFNDYLLVIYKKGSTPLEYRQQFPKNSTAMMSQIILINGKPVEVEANGSYYNPADLLSLGYWGWSEKIAMLLPFDYSPAMK